MTVWERNHQKNAWFLPILSALRPLHQFFSKYASLQVWQLEDLLLVGASSEIRFSIFFISFKVKRTLLLAEDGLLRLPFQRTGLSTAAAKTVLAPAADPPPCRIRSSSEGGKLN